MNDARILNKKKKSKIENVIGWLRGVKINLTNDTLLTSGLKLATGHTSVIRKEISSYGAHKNKSEVK